MLSFFLNLFSKNKDKGRPARVEPTLSRSVSLSPFELAADQLSNDGNMRFSKDSLRARIRGELIKSC